MEILTIGYAVITSFIIIALWNKLDNPVSFLKVRLMIVSGVLLIYYGAYLFKFSRIISFVRVVFPATLIPHWYTETYEFNRVLPNLDHLFASVEQSIFGFQPAIAFAQYFSSKWISEAFYMGYLFYFPMMALVLLYCYFWQRNNFNKLSFIFLASFFIYYLLFIFIPVAGPQFYFPVIGMESVENGIFVNVNNYFYFNNELAPVAGHTDGLFYRLVKMSQAAGENPTAAFPSSHVGISTVLMIWLAGHNKKMMFALFPFYVLLCGATVYIQAHYLIDTVAGWISAFAFYFSLAFCYDKIKVSVKFTSLLLNFLSPAK